MTDPAPIATAVSRMPAADPESPFAEERRVLAHSSTPATPSSGSPFPDPELLDVDAAPTSITRIRAGRPAVVVLYRGAWCPFCNLALRTYQDRLIAPLSERNIALIAISPQKPDGSLTMQEKHSLGYAVLSDPGNRIAGELGVLTHPSEMAVDAQIAAGLDLTTVNADGTTDIPMPTTAIIDELGRLAWIDVHPDYSTRTEPEQILDALHELGIGSGGTR